MNKNDVFSLFRQLLTNLNVKINEELTKEEGNKLFLRFDNAPCSRKDLYKKLQDIIKNEYKFQNVIINNNVPNECSEGRLECDKFMLILKNTKRNPEQHEDNFVNEVKKFIENCGADYIIVTIGGKKYAINDISKTQEKSGKYRKSDISLIGHEFDKNNKDKEIVFISHKKGSDAKDFQQWGGITEDAGDKIHNNPLVQKFVNDIYQHITSNLSVYEKLVTINKGTITVKQGIKPFFSKIPNTSEGNMLKNIIVYGYDFGSTDFGVHNCTCLIQGSPEFRYVSGNRYILTSTAGDDKIHINKGKSTPPLTGDYEPYFWAYYSNNRHMDAKSRFSGISKILFNNLRFAIAPKIFKNTERNSVNVET